jgi:hypothetical protein
MKTRPHCQRALTQARMGSMAPPSWPVTSRQLNWGSYANPSAASSIAITAESAVAEHQTLWGTVDLVETE